MIDCRKHWFRIIHLTSLTKLVYSCFGRYLPMLSKNYKMDIQHCSNHSMRKPLDVYCEDIVLTFKTLKSHWPTFSEKDLEKWEGRPHPIFLTPKSNIKKNDHVWFYRSAVGRNTLGKTVKALIESCEGIDLAGRKFTNKTPRRIGISRLEQALVPQDKGMSITGHRDPKSYKQYNALPERQDDIICQRIISATNIVEKGKDLLYSDVLLQEEEKLKGLEVFFLLLIVCDSMITCCYCY